MIVGNVLATKAIFDNLRNWCNFIESRAIRSFEFRKIELSSRRDFSNDFFQPHSNWTRCFFVGQANVSEADHPLLCEGTRRQRGDLAVMLLVHYKDDPDKLAKIMEKLLDREVRRVIDNGINIYGYSSGHLTWP